MIEEAKFHYQNLGKFSLPNGFRGRGAFAVQLWWLVQSTLFAWSPQFLFAWRSLLLRLFGAQVGPNLRIRPSAKVTYPWRLKTGSNVWIGDETWIYNLATVQIGDNVAIAHRVSLCTGSHRTDSIEFEILAKEIIIQDEAWLANEVFVAPGVTIGKGAVIGARSTVLHDAPEGYICLGSPCRPYKLRNTK